MLYRIVMNVLHMLNVITLIPDLMLPKATLPHGFFLFTLPRYGDLSLISCLTMTAEIALDESPAGRKISITGRQCPQSVKMVG